MFILEEQSVISSVFLYARYKSLIAVSGKAVSGSLAGLPLLSVVSFGFSPPAVSGTLAVLNGDCKAPAEVLSWR